MPSEVKATTPATCLISSCLPGQRRPSLSAPTDGITGPPGPPGLMPPGPPRPPPWRPPPLPPEPPPPEPPPGPPELIGPVTGVLINRCGSSLSASLSFQRPLKSTPAGGACAIFSLAHAARHTTATTRTNRMRQLYMKLARTGTALVSTGGASGPRGCSQIVGSANPRAPFERLEA